MHFLVTGHNGFKGSWLIVLLKELGHKVSGLSLPPTEDSLFINANLSVLLENDFHIDIRNKEKSAEVINYIQPDVIIHLAAQSLVLEGYKNPRITFETNVSGTLNILELAVENEIPILVVTTDKVYRPDKSIYGFTENSPLGGFDPYSASKSMADILTQSYMKMEETAIIGIVRAGNVIGGGDWSKNRLIPDLMRNYYSDEVTSIRMPSAVRPWQHVLDCLNAYLEIVTYMCDFTEDAIFNVGPRLADRKTVLEVITQANSILDGRLKWKIDSSNKFEETLQLFLNIEKAESNLGWKSKLNFEESLSWTIFWYNNFLLGQPAYELMRKDVQIFLGKKVNKA